MYKESCTSWVALSALMVSPPGFRDKQLEKQPTLAKCPKGNFSQGGESEGSFQETSSSGDPFSPHSEMSCPPPGAAVPSMRTAQARENSLQPLHLFWPRWNPWGPASAALQRLPWWDWHHWKGQASPSCHPELLQAQPRGLMSRYDIGFDLAQLATPSPLAEETRAGAMDDRVGRTWKLSPKGKNLAFRLTSYVLKDIPARLPIAAIVAQVDFLAFRKQFKMKG